MKLLAHLSFIAVLDYLIFWYWYEFANRYTVLNFHETGFLPGRYIISGLLAGAVVYWAYLIPMTFIRRFAPHHRMPRWYLLWIAAAAISSAQIIQLVRDPNDPHIPMWAALATVAHIQILHLIMLRVANAYLNRGRPTILPGGFSAAAMMGLWLFWLVYSFHVTAQGDPVPIIGSAASRYSLGVILSLMLIATMIYNSQVRLPRLDWKTVVVPVVDLTLAELIWGFLSAWAMFYLTVPIFHYILRGYVIAHSTLFPAFPLALLVPLGWSLVVMWPILLLQRPSLWGILPEFYKHLRTRFSNDPITR